MDSTNEQTSRLNAITAKFRNLERQITSLQNYLTIHPDATNAHLRLKSITQQYQDCSELQVQLLTTNPDHSLISSFDNISDSYYDVASIMTNLYDKSRQTPLANSTLNTSNITVTERTDRPKLPEIQIPIFDGDRSQWANFKNIFTSFIHNREDLSGSVKASQLNERGRN